MLILLLLPLLHATTTIAAPETRCVDPYDPKIATAASCDNTLNNLQRFMLPCYRQEPVKVGNSRISDIQLRKHFIDDSPDHPPGTARCRISFSWDPKYEKAVKPYPVSPDAYDVLYPSQLRVRRRGFVNSVLRERRRGSTLFFLRYYSLIYIFM